VGPAAEGAPTAATNAAEEPAATDRERAIRCSRSMRLCTRPTALPDAEDEEDGEAHDAAQGQGRTCAQLGHSRRSRSRRQYGHTPPPDLAAGCFRHRHSSPPPPAATATAAFSGFISMRLRSLSLPRLLAPSSSSLLPCSLSLSARVRGYGRYELVASLLKKSEANGRESIIRG